VGLGRIWVTGLDGFGSQVRRDAVTVAEPHRPAGMRSDARICAFARMYVRSEGMAVECEAQVIFKINRCIFSNTALVLRFDGLSAFVSSWLRSLTLD
jgi:hypothetical protein